jgi:O-antigen biosynthesis protein WbqP
MVFVGPRPALYNQDDLMQLRINAGVHKLKPGLTGWAQVNGRDELSLEDKVAYEKEYLERKSFWFDMKIIVLTFTSVLKSKGVTH